MNADDPDEVAFDILEDDHCARIYRYPTNVFVLST